MRLGAELPRVLKSWRGTQNHQVNVAMVGCCGGDTDLEGVVKGGEVQRSRPV